MNVEEALKDAMAAQVAGVHASPSLGQAVRRGNRRHIVRFRVAGAAVLTAAVAVGVPVALTARPDTVPAGGSLVGAGAGDQGAAAGSTAASGDAVATPGGVVPDLTGKNAKEVDAILKEAGYTVRITKIVTDQAPAGTVFGQMPQPGTAAPAGAAVTIIIATTAGPTPAPSEGTEDPGMPQDLGDLGDGRTLGGVHVGYLPEGLEWGKWSGKDGFGKRSYTTSWAEPGLEPGMYSVQMIVYRKGAVSRLTKRMQSYAAQGATAIEIGGRKAYLVSVSEGGDRVMDGGTRTIVWTLAPGVGAEVMISPDYAAKIGADAADRELKKIAAGATLDK
ncbi:PASTA domain-containing protein [Microbispora hainanensis]|uniref:PASTA domain-containing protein n=1 Tax=Microbispora hainanensis TaxID=568844 RepID=A0A544YJ55_9ACTN|nr:PASTA domain-containing protein [Microbispora hainanensis]TQS16552.1 PASTA domain-containing protein [Microbispora hainanensis]